MQSPRPSHIWAGLSRIPRPFQPQRGIPISYPAILFVTSGNRLLDNAIARRLLTHGVKVTPVKAHEAIAILTKAMRDGAAKPPVSVVLYPEPSEIPSSFRYHLSKQGHSHLTPEFSLSGVLNSGKLEEIAFRVMEGFSASTFSLLREPA